MQTIRLTRIRNSCCLINIQHMKKRTNKWCATLNLPNSPATQMHWKPLSWHLVFCYSGTQVIQLQKPGEKMSPSLLHTQVYSWQKKINKGNQKRNSLSRSLLFQIYHLASILFCRTWLTLIFLFNFLLYYHRSVSVMGPKHFLPPSTIAVMLESSCMWSD